jgi:DegV family protein with EDD domain
MPDIHIVTDSSAQFTDPRITEKYAITVVPNQLWIGGTQYREGIDLSAEEAMRLARHENTPLRVHAPSVDDFAAVYRRLASRNVSILSVHPSRNFYPAYEHARQAALQIAGHCPVAVVDSQSISVGQGMLITVAAKASAQTDDLDVVVQQLRSAIDRLYTIFYAETMNPLFGGEIFSQSHLVLGALMRIKPFFVIEEGVLTPMEKARTRHQAVERLVDFVVEFTDIEDVAIVHSRTSTNSMDRNLHDQLSTASGGLHFPQLVYNPSLTALIGTEATGIMLLESEILEDDF